MGLSQFLIFLVLFFVFGLFCCAPPVSGNAEVRALMELKTSLDPEERVLGSWRSDGDHCGAFEGVVCNEHQKVANISLQGKRLTGKLSPAVAGLKCLSGLYLHYNSLSGEIPRDIANLTELTDLYLNVNNISGNIPSDIQNMASLQGFFLIFLCCASGSDKLFCVVLQLCCNQLTGTVPTEIGSLKKLSVLTLQHNRLTGAIPSSLGSLEKLKRLDLSSNQFLGTIPAKLASIPQLEFLDVRNNSLSGVVSPAFKRVKEFEFRNNPGLCGYGFAALRACTGYDDMTINQIEPFGGKTNDTAPRNIPEPVNLHARCNKTHCSDSSKFRDIAIVVGVVTAAVVFTGVVFLTFFQYRRKKQKIGSSADSFDARTSISQAKDVYSRSPSPLVSLEYSNGYPLVDGRNGVGFCQESLENCRFNLEEVESATLYFSEMNLLGRSNLSSVYKGILRDGSVVAIRSLNVTSCKSEETEFVKGLNLLTLLRHQNIVGLRGFCCSRGRGECFLVYDFAPGGNLSRYLDVEEGNNRVLDWPTRVSVINGIAKGIEYLHSGEAGKPALVHQNISAEKILLDGNNKPMIMDSGLPKILADDAVYSALKVSAAMGYLAPEYITTGRFTEKSDVYAFGVIILQILSGKQQLGSSLRMAAEISRFEDLVDTNLKGQFSEPEADKLDKLAILCTQEHPENRPTMTEAIQQLSNSSAI